MQGSRPSRPNVPEVYAYFIPSVTAEPIPFVNYLFEVLALWRRNRELEIVDPELTQVRIIENPF